MTADFTKFPFPTIVNPAASTLTEAITAGPVDAGYVIMTIKGKDQAAVDSAIRRFATAQRLIAADSGLTDITAYRQLRRDELGGAMPFDQPICEAITAATNHADGGIGAQAMATVFANPLADWILLLEYPSPDAATQAATVFTAESASAFGENTPVAAVTTSGAFKNMKRYSSVSRDPNVIQFFNLFGAPAISMSFGQPGRTRCRGFSRSPSFAPRSRCWPSTHSRQSFSSTTPTSTRPSTSSTAPSTIPHLPPRWRVIMSSATSRYRRRSFARLFQFEVAQLISGVIPPSSG